MQSIFLKLVLCILTLLHRTWPSFFIHAVFLPTMYYVLLTTASRKTAEVIKGSDGVINKYSSTSINLGVSINLTGCFFSWIHLLLRSVCTVILYYVSIKEHAANQLVLHMTSLRNTDVYGHTS